MVVLDARVAAVWRIVDGLVGGGVGFREEMLEKGRRDFGGGIEVLTVGLDDFRLPGCERAAAAVLEVRVDGPLDVIGFLEAGLLDAGTVAEGLIAFGFRSGYNSSIVV